MEALSSVGIFFAGLGILFLSFGLFWFVSVYAKKIVEFSIRLDISSHILAITSLRDHCRRFSQTSQREAPGHYPYRNLRWV